MNFETILRFKQFDFLVCYRKLSAHMHMLQYLYYNIGNMHTIFNRLSVWAWSIGAKIYMQRIRIVLQIARARIFAVLLFSTYAFNFRLLNTFPISRTVNEKKQWLKFGKRIELVGRKLRLKSTKIKYRGGKNVRDFHTRNHRPTSIFTVEWISYIYEKWEWRSFIQHSGSPFKSMIFRFKISIKAHIPFTYI